MVDPDRREADQTKTGQTKTQTESDRTGADRTGADRTGSGRAAPDRTTRQAALWATVIALPLTMLVAVLAFGQLSAEDPAAGPTASPTPARPLSTAPVQIAAPRLAERPATVCRALLSRLPDTVNGLRQRPVVAGPEQNAAYGDPAITLACGVPMPPIAPTDTRWLVNRVCWQAVQGADGMVLTTVDREVPVRLTVPPGQEQTVQWAAPVSESVVAAVPSAKDVPAGCAT